MPEQSEDTPSEYLLREFSGLVKALASNADDRKKITDLQNEMEIVKSHRDTLERQLELHRDVDRLKCEIEAKRAQILASETELSEFYFKDASRKLKEGKERNDASFAIEVLRKNPNQFQ